MAAAFTITLGCSDQGSHPAGEALPAPMSPTEDDLTMAAQAAAEGPAFAAFDTDSNGLLDESEWQNKEARSTVDRKNMTFYQIDRDSSGWIDPDEFAGARSDGGANANTSGTVRDPDVGTMEATRL